MLLKVGVNFEPDESIREALGKAHSIFKANKELFIITSLRDRDHKPSSLHFYGKAFDCRIRHISDPSKLERIHSQLVVALSQKYDVLLKPTHIHIETK